MVGLYATLFVLAVGLGLLWLAQKFDKWTPKDKAKKGFLSRFKGLGWGALGLFVASFLVYHFGVSGAEKEKLAGQAKKEVTVKMAKEVDTQEARKTADMFLHAQSRNTDKYIQKNLMAFLADRDAGFQQMVVSDSEQWLSEVSGIKNISPEQFANCVAVNVFSAEARGRLHFADAMEVVNLAWVRQKCLGEFEHGNPYKKAYDNVQGVYRAFSTLAYQVAKNSGMIYKTMIQLEKDGHIEVMARYTADGKDKWAGASIIDGQVSGWNMNTWWKSNDDLKNGHEPVLPAHFDLEPLKLAWIEKKASRNQLDFLAYLKRDTDAFLNGKRVNEAKFDTIEFERCMRFNAFSKNFFDAHGVYKLDVGPLREACFKEVRGENMMRWAYNEIEALEDQYKSMVDSIRSHDLRYRLIRTGLEVLPDHQMRLLVVYQTHDSVESAVSVLMKYGRFVKKSFELGPAVLRKYGELM